LRIIISINYIDMSYTSNFNLNQRVSYLESVINGLIPFLPVNLANTLLGGNSAGTLDIDMSGNDILNANVITANSFSGTATNSDQVLATSDNTNGNYFIPFVKTSGTGQKTLFFDDTTTPISINPSNGAFNFATTLKNDATNNSISFGASAGTSQSTGSVAIGVNSGKSQSTSCVALGRQAGENNQAANSVAIGFGAGATTQQTNSIAIGGNAGNNNQSSGSVAIGSNSGQTTQGANAVSIGINSGQNNQGSNAIAIGNLAGNVNQISGSIAINASGVALNPNASGFFVRPVRNTTTSVPSRLALFDTSNNEIVQTNTVTSRIFQQLGTDPSFNAVNGYYAMAKNVYPTLNPSSSGAKAVSVWNNRLTPASNNYRGICWSAELAIFVAVASTGTDRVMTSPDGITWTPRSASIANAWRDVCWAPELSLFVAIATSGTNTRIMTSPDGITWTTQTSPEDNTWESICWSPELRLFVAVSSNGTNRVMTSINGINWTLPTIDARVYRKVIWVAELGLFINVPSAGGFLRVSTDGINWISASFTQSEYRTMAWSRELGLIVAIGNSATYSTSLNGINWTARTLPFADNGWLGITWSNELKLFLAVGSVGSNRAISSPDGINWTVRPIDATYSWSSVVWSPEQSNFVAVADGGGNERATTSMVRARPPTSYNVFDSSFNNISSNGDWTFQTTRLFNNTSNITIDPSNTLIVDGVLDMSGNNIINCPSLQNTSNITIDPSNTLIVDGVLDMSGNNIINCPSLQNTAGNVELRCNTTGAGGEIILTGGTGLLSGSSSGSAGQFLVITINGTSYKIALDTI
jgi:hypothetical protein